MPERRRSYYVYEAVILVVLTLIAWRYGLVAFGGAMTAQLLAYFQGLDRGVDLANHHG